MKSPGVATSVVLSLNLNLAQLSTLHLFFPLNPNLNLILDLHLSRSTANWPNGDLIFEIVEIARN
jgi:hypothetical protein